MEINLTKSGPHTVVAIAGRFDTVTAIEFEKTIPDLLENQSILVDCSDLEYISSSGLRVFLMLQKQIMAKKSKLALCALRPNIREIFDISGFSGIFTIYPDLSSAL